MPSGNGSSHHYRFRDFHRLFAANPTSAETRILERHLMACDRCVRHIARFLKQAVDAMPLWIILTVTLP